MSATFRRALRDALRDERDRLIAAGVSERSALYHLSDVLAAALGSIAADIATTPLGMERILIDLDARVDEAARRRATALRQMRPHRADGAGRTPDSDRRDGCRHR